MAGVKIDTWEVKTLQYVNFCTKNFAIRKFLRVRLARMRLFL